MKPFKASLDVDIVENDAQIMLKIMKAMLPQLNFKFASSKVKIETITGRLLTQYIRQQPEYAEIVGGTLRYELGLPDAQNRLDAIIDYWANNVNVTLYPFKVNNLGFEGGLTITAVLSDYSDVFKLQESHLQTAKGSDLQWLRWVLTKGTYAIVYDHDVIFKITQHSRTGHAIMVKTKKTHWTVPPEFSGRPGNNFVTRAIKQMEPEFKEKVIVCLQSA